MDGPAPKPCESCPYRRDVPSGVWSASEYEKLKRYDRPTHDQPLAPFQCHQTGPKDDRARLCAGWVGCHGIELLSLRLGVSTQRFDASVFAYTTKVPLFESGTAAAEHGMREIDNPSEAAKDLVAKISKTRSDI